MHLSKHCQRKSGHLIVLRGGMGKKKLDAALIQLATIPEDEDRVVLATGRYLGEGFDDARLDTLFLTMPVSWRGTIAQYVGRLHRMHELKREVSVYDYADLNVPMLAKMFDRRCKGYEAVGYTILLPASAVPGWPPEVPLPVDPEWKRDYSASVQRLIRDGVDPPLGNLFVHAARKMQHRAPRESRGRGARQRPSCTDGLRPCRKPPDDFSLMPCFRSHSTSRGSMEVDLLASETRIAVEIDGPQHLSDPDAYRRDRAKDALLQENGYIVLRFLAEDMGKHLDVVLDRIIRVLAHHERKLSKPYVDVKAPR